METTTPWRAAGTELTVDYGTRTAERDFEMACRMWGRQLPRCRHWTGLDATRLQLDARGSIGCRSFAIASAQHKPLIEKRPFLPACRAQAVVPPSAAQALPVGSRASVAGEGGVGGFVDDEHLRESGDAEDLEDPALVADQLQGASWARTFLRAPTSTPSPLESRTPRPACR